MALEQPVYTAREQRYNDAVDIGTTTPLDLQHMRKSVKRRTVIKRHNIATWKNAIGEFEETRLPRAKDEVEGCVPKATVDVNEPVHPGLVSQDPWMKFRAAVRIERRADRTGFDDSEESNLGTLRGSIPTALDY
jgi:hypothetical protein